MLLSWRPEKARANTRAARRRPRSSGDSSNRRATATIAAPFCSNGSFAQLTLSSVTPGAPPRSWMTWTSAMQRPVDRGPRLLGGQPFALGEGRHRLIARHLGQELRRRLVGQPRLHVADAKAGAAV